MCSEYLAFMERWDRAAPVVVHCYAGISRSTAAAFSALCAARPDLDEEVIALRLRARSPEATPNARIVALADEILGRSGRMVQRGGEDRPRRGGLRGHRLRASSR